MQPQSCRGGASSERDTLRKETSSACLERQAPEAHDLAVTDLTETHYRDGAIQVAGPARRIEADNASGLPQAIQVLLAESHKYISLRTVGDGVCGAHAAFGEPTSQGLFCNASRAKVAVVLRRAHRAAFDGAAVDRHYENVLGKAELGNDVVCIHRQAQLVY